MAVQAWPFTASCLSLCQGLVDLSSDTVKMLLLTSRGSAIYNQQYVSQIFSVSGAVETSGTGYTAGGLAVTGLAVSDVAAGSWPTAWAASTAYAVGQIVHPAGSAYLYMCAVAGTTGASQPTWVEVSSRETVDGTAVWILVHDTVTVVTHDAVTWPNASLTAEYGVFYDSSTGVAETSPLLWWTDFGDPQTVAGTSLIYTPPAGGSLVFTKT